MAYNEFEVIAVLISQVCKTTNLTKKAIAYYIEQGLVSPGNLHNGYREFSEQDVALLKKISVLRKLGLTAEEMRMVLADKTRTVLQTLSVKKELEVQRKRTEKELLDHLGRGESYEEVEKALNALKDNETVAERLLEAFPGYYGRFICLHFARFLNTPIATSDQRAAYEEIIRFLDDLPPFRMPDDLQELFMENTQHIGTEEIGKLLESIRQTMEAPEKFLEDNKEQLEAYWRYLRSSEYLNSPFGQIQKLLKQFNETSGYNSIFLPAMKRLSPSYARYCRQMEAANEKLLARYPTWHGEEDGFLS